MNFNDFLQSNIVILDGGMGTVLQEKGLMPGEHPETWNLSHPEVIRAIHKAYYDSGSNVISTNTFGANLLHFSEEELESVIAAAYENALWAKENTENKEEKFIALDIGPTGKLLKPLGDLDFERAVEIFKKTIQIGSCFGIDLILIETMNDSYETKAALLAAKEATNLPVIVSNAYGEDGKLMTGATPSAMVALLEGMGVSALGANCSLGPEGLRPVIEELLESASVPVLLKPNAGLPKEVRGRTVFDITPEEFSQEVISLVMKGVRLIGGCCGTTPSYISLLSEKTKNLSPVPITKKDLTMVSSYTHAVIFDKEPILIGERINPTGKKRFKQALLEQDMDYILSEGIRQQEKGAHILDVNVGLPDIDETDLLKKSVFELQTVLDLPLQIDSSSAQAMEQALRIYNGKALINSVNGKQESMDKIFPLAKKYGGVIIALTLDENGIPETADGRIKIAEKILSTAEKFGIDKKDIIFDTLAMTISADQNSATTTLDSLRYIKETLGCHTSLGVSNISFGLPSRDVINGIFFSMALENGLSAAIMNPHSAEMMKTYYAYRALKGLDENFADYIVQSDSFASVSSGSEKTTTPLENADAPDLQKAIIKGLKEKAGEITKEKLKETPPLEIINSDIIPALNFVGSGFEKKTIYLPQLLMSAEAAKSAFDVIKSAMPETSGGANGKKIILATVKGDIHDIGKNIVKLLLENYGFDVIDLGKDVTAETIANKAAETKTFLVGLSALMTTTVPAMEETIALLRKKVPECKVMVGGAVLTEDYAKKIGADYYGKDAMGAVRFAKEIFSEQ